MFENVSGELCYAFHLSLTGAAFGDQKSTSNVTRHKPKLGALPGSRPASRATQPTREDTPRHGEGLASSPQSAQESRSEMWGQATSAVRTWAQL